MIEHPEYGAMTEGVHREAEMMVMACEAEAYGEREGDDLRAVAPGGCPCKIRS